MNEYFSCRTSIIHVICMDPSLHNFHLFVSGLENGPVLGPAQSCWVGCVRSDSFFSLITADGCPAGGKTEGGKRVQKKWWERGRGGA